MSKLVERLAKKLAKGRAFARHNMGRLLSDEEVVGLVTDAIADELGELNWSRNRESVVKWLRSQAQEPTEELADALKFIADGGELSPGDPELLREAAARLREMDGKQYQGWATVDGESVHWIYTKPQPFSNPIWKPAILILKPKEQGE